ERAARLSVKTMAAVTTMVVIECLAVGRTPGDGARRRIRISIRSSASAPAALRSDELRASRDQHAYEKHFSLHISLFLMAVPNRACVASAHRGCVTTSIK